MFNLNWMAPLSFLIFFIAYGNQLENSLVIFDINTSFGIS